MRRTPPNYDIAISFAGEDRPLAEQLASALVVGGWSVFYDEYLRADLWGKDLYVHLTEVYRDDAKFCLMLVSEHYEKKQWTNHERRAAQARALSENYEYILPLRLDDTPVPGILDTTCYLDYRQTTVEKVVEAVIEKVLDYNKKNGIRYDLARVEDVLAKAGIQPKGGRSIKDTDLLTTCPACGSVQRLSDAVLSLDRNETTYTCMKGCQPILVVGRPGTVPWPGRGWRMGDYVVRNVRGLLLKTEDMHNAVCFSAREAAFMKSRPEGK